MAKKNKNVFWLIAAGIAALYLWKRSKDKAAQKTATQPGANVLSAAQSALANQLQNVDFIPGNESDRNKYANDQNLCK